MPTLRLHTLVVILSMVGCGSVTANLGQDAGAGTGAEAAAGGGPNQGGAGIAGTSGWSTSGTGGGVSGTSGQCRPDPQPPVCGASECGDSVRDTCTVSGQSCSGPQAPQVTEECDGPDLGSATCASHGFGAGTLSCSTRCTVKTAACTECVPGVAAVTSCGHPIDPGNFHWPTTPSLAGSDGAVALAWTHFLSELRYTLSLAVIEPTDDEPTVIGLEGFDDDTPPPLLRSNMGTAVAPLGAGGWLVATAGEPEVVARAVSADGAVLSRTTLDTIAADTFDWPRADIVVAPRAAGPLVVWSRKTWIRAAVIAADGRSATPTFALPLDGRSITSTPTAVFTGGAFYVGYTTSGIQEQSLRLVRVASDGTVTKLADLEPTEHTKYPYLAAGTDDLRLSYVGPPPGALAPSVLWRRVSLNGATLAGPTVVGTAPGWNGPSPVAAAGGDTMVLVGGREGHTLGLARVALDGTISQPAAVIAKSPYELQPHGLVRRGAELVATWSATRINDLDGGPRIGLARITP